jgi:hypothetical protein
MDYLNADTPALRRAPVTPTGVPAPAALLVSRRESSIHLIEIRWPHRPTFWPECRTKVAD